MEFKEKKESTEKEKIKKSMKNDRNGYLLEVIKKISFNLNKVKLKYKPKTCYSDIN